MPSDLKTSLIAYNATKTKGGDFMHENKRYSIDDVMTVSEAVYRYGIKRATLNSYVGGRRLSSVDPDKEIEAGRLRAYKIPGTSRSVWYVTADFIDRYFNADGSPKNK